MKKALALTLSLVMAASLSLAGCGSSTDTATDDTAAEAEGEETSSSDSGDVIKIGVLEPITGSYAAGGAIEIEGIEIANSERPTVTVDGTEYTIELVQADNKSDKVEAVTAAQRLIENDNVTAIIGSYSSVPSVGASEAVKAGETPTVGVSCTNPLVTEGNDWYFRVCFIDPYQGTVMAYYAYEELGATKVGVAYDVASDYSTGLAQYFMEEFKNLTGDEDSIVEATYQTGDQDFSAQITNLAAAEPDCFFVPGNYTECALLIKQARQQGVELPMLGGDTFEINDFLEVGGDEVDGTVFSTFFDSNAELSSKTGEFVANYREANGTEPAGVTALAYDAYMLICDALESCGSTDRAALRDAIAAIQYEGVTGLTAFDENGDPSKPAVIKVANTANQTFDYVTTISVE
ncbi:MAG: ABC transporter substrate-binding protein [Clostridiales bacterium]|nr:ABC transporter substrate-binding protein [Clostridiales bacterium]